MNSWLPPEFELDNHWESTRPSTPEPEPVLRSSLTPHQIERQRKQQANSALRRSLMISLGKTLKIIGIIANVLVLLLVLATCIWTGTYLPSLILLVMSVVLWPILAFAWKQLVNLVP